VDFLWISVDFGENGVDFGENGQVLTPTDETFEWGVGGSSVSLVGMGGFVGFCRSLSIWVSVESVALLCASVDFGESGVDFGESGVDRLRRAGVVVKQTKHEPAAVQCVSLCQFFGIEPLKN
jgi:hypothetical protein